jgi:glycine oxidase
MRSVLVIGGGVIGCAAALEIARRGDKVTVLERAPAVDEAAASPAGTDARARGPMGSTAAAGILGAQLEGLRGDGPLSRLCLASRALYPSWERRIRELSGRDIELRPAGVTVVALDAARLRALEAEVAWQERAGLPVERLDATALAAIEPSLSRDAAGGVRFAEDARVDPPSLLAALRLAVERAGGVVRSGAPVARIILRGGRAAGVALKDGVTLDASAVVVSAGSWSTLIGETSLVESAMAPARGQIVELKLPSPVLRGVIEGPSCYLSPRDDGRVLVGSTIELVGFAPGTTAKAIRDLLSAALHLAPALEGATLRGAWSGFRPRALDERPLLGGIGVEGLIVATGHYRNGVLLAPITGAIVAAHLAGDAPPVDIAPFDPRRPMAPVPVAST